MTYIFWTKDKEKKDENVRTRLGLNNDLLTIAQFCCDQFQVSSVNNTEVGHTLHSLSVDSLVLLAQDGPGKIYPPPPPLSLLPLYSSVFLPVLTHLPSFFLSPSRFISVLRSTI